MFLKSDELKKKNPASFDLGGYSGLSEAEALSRQARYGLNEIPSQKKRSIFAIAFEVVREPMFLMLVAAGSLYLFMGEPADALMLLGFVFVVMGITIVQEKRTEKALDALRDLSSPRALVIREGVQKRIAGKEVVQGDIIILAEGDRVPADAVLRRGINLSVDESLLTGESVPVRKMPSEKVNRLDKPGGDDLSSLFSGTLVTAGQGLAEVLNVGLKTELGKIGKALQQAKSEATPLQKETAKLVRTFAMIGLSACIIVVVAYALTRGGGWMVWKEGLLAGIAMAMAILPEEFPVVLTVFLALGAWRISRSNVLTRRMPAVETLGSATVLCVDKTGTLTLNQMKVKQLATNDASVELNENKKIPENLQDILEDAFLSSKSEPFDPMEKAIHVAASAFITPEKIKHSNWQMIREYPLSPELLCVTQVWNKNDGNNCFVASKGAPEAIARLCHMNSEEKKILSNQVIALASQGLRVLGVARGLINNDKLPEKHLDLKLEFVGLIGFEDPLRPTVKQAVNECREAGVRVIMITGDYPATAESIARQAGIESPGGVITGPELDKMSDADLAEHIKNVRIFARVVPEQKLRIVAALKANKEVVAMTGDGVNDAPALKAAHIGIAMGGRGTDVAREASSLVLLDDDFSSIVGAIRLGRRIFDNIKKAIAFIFAVHVPIAGISILPVFFSDWPLLLLPVHIVFLELIIDPSCTLVFEAEKAEDDVMKRPPRNPNERLFSLRTIGIAVLQGLSSLSVCVVVYVLAKEHHSVDSARALTFITLVVSFITIILANRSWKRTIIGNLREPNSALWLVICGTVVFLTLILILPQAHTIFHFGPLHITDILLSITAGIVCILWFEIMKVIKKISA